MTHVRRLCAVAALLAVATCFTAVAVRGGPGKDVRKDLFDRANRKPDLEDNLAATKFAERPVVTYVNRDGKTIFGWQVKPTLAAAPARPRDYLILVDTSASQARGPLENARLITEAVIDGLAEGDVAAVWTANVEPKKLTKTFLAKDKHADTRKALKTEYPSGATNLRKALTEATKAFDNEIGRQRVILFLGDGLSVAGPIDGDDLTRLAADMVKNQIAFYSVPLGAKLDPLTLHGLATATGGKVVRLIRENPAAELAKELDAALKVPVIYPDVVRFSDAIAEAYPLRMPPLRADDATLVVGELKPGAERVGITIAGNVAGQELRVDAAELVPGDEADNFFLQGMFAQWRDAKDRPALLKADRAMTFAYEQMQIARAELLAQAEWALEKNELDAAVQLYEQALKLDHGDGEAKAGKRIAQQIKEGKLTRDDLRKILARQGDDAVRIIAGKAIKAKVDRKKMIQLAQRDEQQDKADEAREAKKADDLLNQVKQRQAVEDQRTTEMVRDAVFDAGRMLRTNPDAAIDLLKRTREGIKDNPDITDRTKFALSDRLQDEIRNLSVRGEEIRRTLTERARAMEIARERLAGAAEQQASEDRIKERMKAINSLITKAKVEIIRDGEYQNRLVAIRAAENLKRQLTEEGRPIPPALTAAYGIAQADFHLQELKELRRQREQRFLLSMLQVERRHMPFPDEPPIEFPPAARWKALTQSRKSKYESFRFLGGGSNKGLKRVLDVLNQVQPEFPEIPADPQTKLESMLIALQTRFSRPQDNPPFQLVFEINIPAFKAEQMDAPGDVAIVMERGLKKETNITLASYLRKILERVPVPSGATYVIRKEEDLPLIVPQFDERDLPPPPNYVVEITTYNVAGNHSTKVSGQTVAYSVSDLVVPIPNSINQQAIQQSGTLFGQFGQQGAVQGQFGQFGQFGQLGQFGQIQLGALGALGALGGQIQLGALGALGALGGQLGQLGQIGGQLGQAGVAGQVLGGGQVGVQGQNNFGVGGGQLGFQGGQLGQFGNLGGQFGLQGGTQEQILIKIIKSTVGEPRDWVAGYIFQQPDPTMPPPMDSPLNNPEGADIGYFPSALALVVKGSSVIHARRSRISSAPMGGAPANMMGMLPRQGGDAVAVAEPKKDPKGEAVAAKKPFKSDVDPRVAWQDGIDQGAKAGEWDPGMIVATADFLLLLGKFDQATELLKANLRHGVIVKPWVYETLSICLKETKASEEEIERAEVALADLEPDDVAGFLKASQAMANMKRYDRALAFCRQASILEPNAPQSYADALNYAELAKDARSMEWAAGNLLKQDWPRKNGDLHGKAVEKVNALSKELGNDKPKEAASLKAVVQQHQQRDLIIRLSWVGQADLDLKVQEPSGSVCSSLNRQTPNGGTFQGDTLLDKNAESYAAAQAFPGKYKITIDRVWGATATGKAQVQVIRYKGTDRETTQFHTIDVKEREALVLDLSEGRRTEAASVPPPALQLAAEDLEQGTSTEELLGRLRDLADPDSVGATRGFRSIAGSPAAMPTEDRALEVKGRLETEAKRTRRDMQMRQITPVSSNVRSNVGFTSQAELSEDGKSVRLSLNAVFNNFVNTKSGRAVNIPIIPGMGGGKGDK